MAEILNKVLGISKYKLHTVMMGNKKSLWLATTNETNYPSLNKNLEVDVAVIGGV